MDGTVFVSRLRWDRTPNPHEVEVPHANGHSVPVAVGEGDTRVREWPNRLGILETGRADDRVRWHRDLTAIEPDGQWTCRPQSGPDEPEMAKRTKWFVKLLKRLEQTPGVTAHTVPEAPCAILLTPGIGIERLRHLDRSFSGEVQSLARILPEFAGGLQLRLSEAVWARRQEYAEAIERLLREDE